MRTAEQKALLHRLYDEALQGGDLALIERLFAPDFVDHSTPDQPAGPAGVRDYFHAVRCGFPDIQVTVEQIIAENDHVAVRTIWRGTHLGSYEGLPASGQRVSRTLIQIFRMTDGLICEEWNEGSGLLDMLHKTEDRR
jgi:steroid delta-isomerase-like uncharacterized protein